MKTTFLHGNFEDDICNTEPYAYKVARKDKYQINISTGEATDSGIRS